MTFIEGAFVIFDMNLTVYFLNLHLFELQDFKGIVAFAQGTGNQDSGLDSQKASKHIS